MIKFANPTALLLLAALLPVLLALAYATRQRRNGQKAFGRVGRLHHGIGPGRRTLQYFLLLGALTLTIISVARPQWGSEERTLTRLGVDIAIALDISRSMTANDVEPSRAEAVKAALENLLNHLRGDRVGLVTFAGNAFERSPLTLDLEAIQQLIARAQNETALVKQGTDIAAALDAALQILEVENPAKTQVIVLISDGENLANELSAVLERLEERGIRVFSVVAGTTSGGTMTPRENTGTNELDNEISRADRTTLRTIAQASGGDLRELEELVGLAVEFQRLRQSIFDESKDEAPIERFQWFLGGAITLLSLHMLVQGRWRKSLLTDRITLKRTAIPWIALPTIALIIACTNTEFRLIDAGNSAYTNDQLDKALTSYRDAAESAPDAPELHYNIGNTLHRLGDYEEANVASTVAMSTAENTILRTHATYAIGSHAFRKGDLERARKAWIDVLLHNPYDQDAKHNLELTLRLLQDDRESTSQLTEREKHDADKNANSKTRQGPNTNTPATSNVTQEQSVSTKSGRIPEIQGRQQERTEPITTLEQARAKLSESILTTSDEMLSLEEALSLLDLVRLTNQLGSLEHQRDPKGRLPDR